MRKLRTGAETDTSPKDGENIRSSRLSADLAKKNKKVADQEEPEKKQEGEREEKQKAVSREGLSPVRMHRTCGELQMEHAP